MDDLVRNIVKKLNEVRLLKEQDSYSSMDKEDLIKLAKAGDQLAMTTLLKLDSEWLRRMTKKYVGKGVFDYDDIRQIAEIAYWEAVRDWNGSGDFMAYAGMIVKRRLVDEYRKTQSWKEWGNYDAVSADDMESQDMEDDAAGAAYSQKDFKSYIDKTASHSAEEDYIDDASAKALLDYIERELTDVEYKVLSLYMDGHKMAKIAEELDLKYKTCENALMRAKAKLRYYLNNLRECRSIIEEGQAASILHESNATLVRDTLNDLDIRYENISEEDGVVYVTNTDQYSQQDLNRVWDSMTDAEGAGFDDGMNTMWFSFQDDLLEAEYNGMDTEFTPEEVSLIKKAVSMKESKKVEEATETMEFPTDDEAQEYADENDMTLEKAQDIKSGTRAWMHKNH